MESTSIKNSIEEIYSNYLPKGNHPFIYLSLLVKPENVDVNVHPTKKEVHILHESEIIQSIQSQMNNFLLNSHSSRTFYLQNNINNNISNNNNNSNNSNNNSNNNNNNINNNSNSNNVSSPFARMNGKKKIIFFLFF